MTAPVLEAFTQRRGALTKAAAAAVPLSALMLVSGGGSPITAWAVTQTGGAAGHWTLTTDGNSPTPSTAGDNAELNGGPYAFSVTATNGDGTSSAATLTVDIAAGVYTVSKPAEVDTTLRSGTDNGAPIRANIGGKSVEFARGTAGLGVGTTCVFRSFNTHTGRLTVTSEDQSNPTVIARIQLDGGCSRIDFSHITFQYQIAAHGPAVGGSPDAGAGQGLAMFQAVYSNTLGICSDIALSNCTMGADPSANDPSQWVQGISITGQTVSPWAPHTNFTVSDITLTRVKDGIVPSFLTDSTFQRIVTDRFCSNAWFAGQLQRVTYQDAIHCRPMINRADPADHRDFLQTGTGGVQNNDSNVFSRIMLITGDGNSGSQGPFFDDVSYTQSKATGFFQNDTTLQNVFYDGSASQGINLDGGSGWIVQRNTVIRGECRDTAAVNTVTGAFTSPGYLKPVLKSPNPTAISGTAVNNIVQEEAGSNLSSGFSPTITDPAVNAILQTLVAEPAGWGSQAYQDESVRSAYYSNGGAWFVNPGTSDIDYATMTAVEIAIELRKRYAPVLNGAFKNADGSYKGNFFPWTGGEVSWPFTPGLDLNDGTVFGLSTPTAYIQVEASGSTLVGAPVPITYTLNAPATSAETLTPHVSGLGGSFSNATVVIGIGDTTGSVTFTPAASGTATLTDTNGGSLTNPVSLTLTVSDPVSSPTTFSQSASASVAGLGSGLPLVYVLDDPALSDETITPACSLRGVFVPSTVTIRSGNSVGTTTFVASQIGSGYFTAANGSGLTDPAPLPITVSAMTRGQLAVLGVR